MPILCSSLVAGGLRERLRAGRDDAYPAPQPARRGARRAFYTAEDLCGRRIGEVRDLEGLRLAGLGADGQRRFLAEVDGDRRELQFVA